jgi:hypothetical protein
VKDRIKGVQGGDYSDAIITAVKGKETVGLSLKGSFCAQETRRHYFLIVAQRSAFLVINDEDHSVTPHLWANPLNISKEMKANKCYPFALTSFATEKWIPNQIALAISTGLTLSKNELSAENSLTTQYSGCTDGWTGTECDIPMKEITCSKNPKPILAELLALFFY